MRKKGKIISIVLIVSAINNINIKNAIAYEVKDIQKISNANLLIKNEVVIKESKGFLESASIEWTPVKEATGYNVYYKIAGTNDANYIKLDNELIRRYPNNFRADILGLKEGEYQIKIIPIINNKEVDSAQVISKHIEVISHTREGFAFSKQSAMKTSSGGYNDDGTVSKDAQVIYITSKNINTVKANVIENKTGKESIVIGLTNILSARSKGYDKRPLIIRMIGQVNANDIKGLNSSGYIEIKGAYNITFEGVGEDSTAYKWGFLIKNSKNIEVRNIGIMLFPDDAISLDSGNENIWIHNNDIFYGSAGSDADQVKGDGSADVKGKSTYVTISYNHFYDSGKVSLCGMNDTEEFFVTYHHNWFDHSDSRHPRIRVGSVHIYNNYFDGNSKYGVGVTKGSSAFVEANYFRNCKYPMLTSLQGSDISNSSGNFSGEPGGMIKSYNNTIIGAKSIIYAKKNSSQFDAYLAYSRDEIVPSNYKTANGGNTYNNFDTSFNMYKYIPDSPDKAIDKVVNYAGRVNGGDFKWKFTSDDDTSYKVNIDLMNAIKSYKSNLLSVYGNCADESNANKPLLPESPIEEEKPDIEKKSIIHNFTTDNKESKFFEINGKVSNNKKGINYKGLLLTKYLKLETSTSIKFKTDSNSKITLVLNNNFNKGLLIDGVKYKAKNGIINIDLKSGEHSITKADSCNLYYISIE